MHARSHALCSYYLCLRLAALGGCSLAYLLCPAFHSSIFSFLARRHHIGTDVAADPTGSPSATSVAAGTSRHARYLRWTAGLLALIHALALMGVLVCTMALLSTVSSARDGANIASANANASAMVEHVAYEARKMMALAMDAAEPPLDEVSARDDTRPGQLAAGRLRNLTGVWRTGSGCVSLRRDAVTKH